jgi:hypothetical protein
MSEYTVEQVLNIAEKLSDVLETKTGVVNGAVVRKMLHAYADTLSKPADSGRVWDVVAWCDAFDRDVAHWGPTHYLAARLKTATDMLRALAAQGQGDAVAEVWSLRYPSDRRLNLSTVFDTEQEAREYADKWSDGAEVVPLCARSATAASPAGVPDGWKLAMFVLQSGMYAKLPEEERAVCDALIAENPFIAAPSAPEGDGGAE